MERFIVHEEDCKAGALKLFLHSTGKLELAFLALHGNVNICVRLIDEDK